MIRKKKFVVREHLLGLIIMVGVCATALAFASGIGVDNLSQLAAGNMADLMCVGGADAKCQCGKGLKDGKCDPKKPGGGKIGCPCSDVTSGDVAASGKCATVGKCKADKADGMMPMLPMIPMMMPKMEMPMMPKPCVPKAASTTSATSSPATSTAAITRDPWSEGEADCQDFGGGWGSDSPFYAGAYDSGGGGYDDMGFDDQGDSVGGNKEGVGTTLWGRVLDSIGLSGSSDESGGADTIVEIAGKKTSSFISSLTKSATVGLKASRGGTASGGARPQGEDSEIEVRYVYDSGSTFAQASPFTGGGYGSPPDDLSDNPFVSGRGYGEETLSLLEYLKRILQALLAIILGWAQ